MSTNNLYEYRVVGNPNGSPIVRKGTNERIFRPTVDIPNTCTVNEEREFTEGGKTVKRMVPVQLRFIAHCPSIVMEEQIEKYKIPRDYQPTASDFLWMEDGYLPVNKEQFPNKVEYLERCAWNKDSKGRRSGDGVIFYKVDKKAEAQKELDTFDVELEAMQVVADAKKDAALLARIGEHFALGNASREEILADLVKKAKAKPALVLAAVAQHQVSLAHTVSEARQLKVVVRSGGEITWGGTDQKVVSFRVNLTDEEAFAVLEKHLASPKGKADLDLLKAQVESARKTELEQVNN